MKEFVAKSRALVALVLVALCALPGCHAQTVSSGVAAAIAEAKTRPHAPVTYPETEAARFGMVTGQSGKPTLYRLDPKTGDVRFVDLTKFAATIDNPAGWTIDPTTGALTAPSGKVIAGVSFKQTPYAISTTLISTKSGLAQTVDGQALNNAGMRVWQVTVGASDGCYVVASGAWTHCDEAATGADMAGAFFAVGHGTSNKGLWIVTNAAAAGIVGTNTLTATNLSTLGGGGAVSSVNTQTGAVVLGAKDVAALGGIVVDAVTIATPPAYTAAGAGVGKTLTLNASAACPTLGGLTPTTTTTGVVGSYNTLLLQNPASFVDFGVYDVTTSTGSSCVLTRDTRADTMIEILSTTVRVAQGNRRGALYQYGGDPTITLDTGLGSYERIDAAVGTNEVFDQTCEFGSDMVPSGNVANGTVGVGNCPFVASVSGTGAAITQSAGTATESGVFIMGGGSTSGGFSAWTGNTSTLPVLIDVNQGALFEVRWTGPSVLSNGTNRFGMFAGWASATNLPNAIGIEYLDSTASTWFGNFCSSSTCTTAATGLPTVVINTYSRGRVFKYPGESAFHVVVDGTEATGSPFSTNVPLNVAVTPVIEIFDTIGSATNATFKLDYVRQRQWWPQGRGQ